MIGTVVVIAIFFCVGIVVGIVVVVRIAMLRHDEGRRRRLEPPRGSVEFALDGGSLEFDRRDLPEQQEITDAWMARHGPGGGPSGRGAGRVRPARPRYLVGQCPESVAVDKPFSLLASINLAASPTSAELELFDVSASG